MRGEHDPAWPATAAIALGLAGLIAWSFASRWAVLDATPFPTGVDGYFYPVQLRALLDSGQLQYPAPPLALWLLAPFAAATDPITGAKLGAALLGAAIALPAYGVGARLGRCRGAGLVAAALATTSAGSMYLTIEFVKNGIGLTVALTALWLVLRACERPSRGRLAGAIAGLAAAVLAHKMAAALALGLALPAALAAAAGRGALRGRRLGLAIALAAAVVAAALGLGLAFPDRFASPADAALLGELLADEPRWSAPALARDPTLAMGHEALIGALIAIPALAALAVPALLGRARPGAGERKGDGGRAAGAERRRVDERRGDGGRTARAERRCVDDRRGDGGHTAGAERRRVDDRKGDGERTAGAERRRVDDRKGDGERAGTGVIAIGMIALALMIGLPWLAVDDPQGLGFRLRIAAFVPMALCAATLTGRVLSRLPLRDLVLAVIAVALVDRGVRSVEAPGRRIEGEIITHPALVTGVLALARRIPDAATAIVPERHIAFMVAWYARARISITPEPVAPERRVRILALSWIEPGSPLDDALLAARAQPGLAPPVGGHPRHPNGLVLVPEATWQWALGRLPPAARARWGAWPTI